MKRILAMLFVSIGLFGLYGCDDGGYGPESAVRTAQKSYDPDPEHYALIESLDYETFSGVMQPGMGGLMTAVAKTWPGTCYFGINVPPEALPSEQSSTTFSLSVPTYASYMAHAAENLPLILRLEPEGIRFQVPVTVLATWMPWDDRTPDEYFNVEPVYENGVLVDTIADEFGTPSVTKIKIGWRVMFSVGHFSDWETNGGGGGK